MSKATAWLLDFGATQHAAVGERELLHLLPQGAFLPVPLAPRHCAAVMEWQGELLPVWDMRVWLGETTDTAAESLAAIVAYQYRPRQTPHYGVIVLRQPPLRVQVDDSQACGLPSGAPWRTIATTGFSYGEQAVPILDLLRMFTPGG